MKLFSEGEVSYLTLEVVEAQFSRYPSLQFRAEVSDRGFQASSTVWVAVDDVKTIVAQLRQCWRMGQNEALLSGVTPTELELRIIPSDTLGHFHMAYRLGRQCLDNAGWQELDLTGGFDLDVQFWQQMVDSMELLAL